MSAWAAQAVILPFSLPPMRPPDFQVLACRDTQTHGLLLNWQPHIHAQVTDGGFCPDGTFMHLLAHYAEAPTAAW